MDVATPTPAPMPGSYSQSGTGGLSDPGAERGTALVAENTVEELASKGT